MHQQQKTCDSIDCQSTTTSTTTTTGSTMVVTTKVMQQQQQQKLGLETQMHLEAQV